MGRQPISCDPFPAEGPGKALDSSVPSPVKQGVTLFFPPGVSVRRLIKPPGQPPDTRVGDSPFVLQIRKLKLKGVETLSSV